jgi:hypothetical protein
MFDLKSFYFQKWNSDADASMLILKCNNDPIVGFSLWHHFSLLLCLLFIHPSRQMTVPK